MTESTLLVNVGVALMYALAGGLLARRLRLPTIVGYLMAGVALSPFSPGFSGDSHTIQQMADFGIVLLMFGVGLHFSFRDLWQVRTIAIPGALLQMLIVSAIGYQLGRGWGLSVGGAWVFAIAISVASTVVVTRGLMDHGWLDTVHGKVSVGWLVFEDLVTVAILVILPGLAAVGGENPWPTVAMAVGKAAVFLTVMMFFGDRLVPKLLGRVAHTRSRELFVLVALAIAVGTALVSSMWFGVSLALGAFVAGVVVGESEFSHQVGADLLPFREAFAVLFFVSVGMLVNPRELAGDWQQILIVSAVIVIGKALVSGGIGIALGSPVRTSLVVAASRSQIGEFSFIVGQTGLSLGLIDQRQYSLILAGAIVSIMVNPFMLRLVVPVERWLQRRPRIWRVLDRERADLLEPTEPLSDHVVIVGCGRVGRHIAEALGRLNIPRMVVEADPARVDKLRQLGVPVLYGDAGNSDILQVAGLQRARALVITLPDDVAALAVVATSKKQAPSLRIVARASTWDGARQLRAAGADEIVRPELEGGVEIVRRTLLDLELPVREVQRYTDLVRREGLDETERPSPQRARVLNDLVTAARDLEVGWLVVVPGSAVADRTLIESDLRSKTGVSVVAIGRQETLISNPAADEVLRPGDRVAVIGTVTQVALAEWMFQSALD